MAIRHFLSLNDLTSSELMHVIHRAIEMKKMQRDRIDHAKFKNYVLAMIFEKSSTRTRVSFEAGFAQLGGHAMFLSSGDTQMGRGEPIQDTAKVISSMVDIIMIRTFGHDIIEEFAKHSSVPVINALTDKYHPCQLLADLQTYIEHRGSIQGKRVAWVGDGNNMCQSYINAAALLDFELSISCPVGYEPDADLLSENADRVTLGRDPIAAVKNADLVVTDTWASMGQEDEKRQRIADFKGYQVNDELMSHAKPDALFMHCLPAYRGMEIAENTLNAPYSIVWDEAENRLHAQKALMEFLLEQ